MNAAGGALQRVAWSGLLMLGLAGCQGVTGGVVPAQVRLLDTSPDAPALDIYQGGTVLAYDLEFGFKTSYIPITPGAFTLAADGAGTRQQLVAASGTFLAQAQYTVLIGNYSNALQELILKDQSVPSPAGEVNLRFIDQSVRGGGLDFYLVPVGASLATQRPIASNLTFNTNTGYYSLPAGTYTLVATAAGSAPKTSEGAWYTGSAVTYAAGAAQSFVIIDQPPGKMPGVQVISAIDYDPAGAAN